MKRPRRAPASSSKASAPNFPPRLKLTYKDDEGKTVRILPTSFNEMNTESFDDPLWSPKPYGGDGDYE